MPETPYSKRELDYFFAEVHKKLDAILEQTTKTNGRVTACEMQFAEMRGKAKIASILWGGLAAIIVSVVGYFLNNRFNS